MSVLLSHARQVRVDRLLRRHPEWWVLLAALAAWYGMIPHMFPTGPSCHAVQPSLGAELWGWGLMVVAMMVPLTSDGMRFVASRVPRKDRAATIALYVAGFLAPWLALGLPAALLAHRVWPVGTLWAAVFFALAGLWYLSPARQRAAGRCHRTAPIGLRGRAWLASVGGLGLRRGQACAQTCAPAMIACALTGHHALAMAAGLGLGLWERQGTGARPERWAGVSGALALFFLAKGLAG